MIYFHSFRSPGLTIDIVRDIRALNDLSLKAKKAGMIILGGGVCKHQIANAMLIVSAYNCYICTLTNPVTLAKRCRLFSVHSEDLEVIAHLGSNQISEHWARIRWFRLWRSTR